MTIFSLYIFDRHCTCVYYQDWARARRAKPADESKIPPAVSRALIATSAGKPADLQSIISPRSTLTVSSGLTIASIAMDPPASVRPEPSPLSRKDSSTAATVPTVATAALSFDEEAKLVFGVVLSLRNMVKKLSGRDEQFTNYRTSTYKLHLFETPSGYKFVMLTHPSAESVRPALRSVYTGPFLEYVVKNPLVKMDSRERGIDNEQFRAAVDRLVRSMPVFT